MKRTAIILFVNFFALSFVSAQDRKVKEIEQLVTKWVNYNNSHNIEHLTGLYDVSLFFYGKLKDMTACLEDKEDFFKKYPNYSISISQLEVDFYKSGAAKANFFKTENWGAKEHKGNGYLIFEKKNGVWLITGESDQRMDAKTGNTPVLGTKLYGKNIFFPVLVGVVIGIALLALFFLVRVRKRKSNGSTVAFNQPIVQGSSQVPLSSEDKGLMFEKYIVGLFDKKSGRFTLKDWRGDKIANNGVTAESAKYPDLRYTFCDNNKEYHFAIECKWRKQFTYNEYKNKGVRWAEEYQVSNYFQYQTKENIPVWVAIGVGGSPDKPECLYLLPLSNIVNYPFVFESYLKGYSRNPAHSFFYDCNNNRLV